VSPGALATLSNGCAGSGCTQAVETYAYNDRLQLVEMELGTSTNAAGNYCLVYNYYQGAAQPTSCTNAPAQAASGDDGSVGGYYYQDNLNSGLSHTASFTYDGDNRLATAIATGNSTYNLLYRTDLYGNTSCSLNGNTQGLCPQYSFNANNQISNAGYTHDAAGNLTYDGTYTYEYDAEGRVHEVLEGGSAISTTTYNALGEAAERVAPTFRVDHIFDAGGGILGIFNEAGGWAEEDVPGVGSLMSFYDGANTLFIHRSGVGSTAPTQITDEGDNPLGDETFYPYGQQWNYADEANSWWQFYGGSRRYDADLELHLTPHRSYPPILGRWLTPDPAGQMAVDPANPQTWNMYAYVGDNPTSLNDPSGLYTWGQSCGPMEAACQKRRQEFRNALAEVTKARNSFNPKSRAYKRLSRLLAAYGTEGHGGPAIAFGKVAKGFGGNFNPATNTVTLDLARYGNSSLGELNLGTLVAHEGEHYADRALQMARSQYEYRAYEATSWTAQGEGGGRWVGIHPNRGVLWNSTWGPGTWQENFTKGFLEIWRQDYSTGPVVMPYDPFPNE